MKMSYKKAVNSVYFTAAVAPAVAVWVWRPCAVLVAHFSAVRPYLGSQELISLISVDGDTHALFMAPTPRPLYAGILSILPAMLPSN